EEVNLEVEFGIVIPALTWLLGEALVGVGELHIVRNIIRRAPNKVPTRRNLLHVFQYWKVKRLVTRHHGDRTQGPMRDSADGWDDAECGQHEKHCLRLLLVALDPRPGHQQDRPEEDEFLTAASVLRLKENARQGDNAEPPIASV